MSVGHMRCLLGFRSQSLQGSSGLLLEVLLAQFLQLKLLLTLPDLLSCTDAAALGLLSVAPGLQGAGFPDTLCAFPAFPVGLSAAPVTVVCWSGQNIVVSSVSLFVLYFSPGWWTFCQQAGGFLQTWTIIP